MPQVNVEHIVDHLSNDMRKALEAAVNEVMPDAEVDAYELFRAFRRAVARKCGGWQNVPEQFIRR